MSDAGVLVNAGRGRHKTDLCHRGDDTGTVARSRTTARQHRRSAMPTGAVRALLECLLPPLRHQFGMAHFDRSAFKILGNVIVVSRHRPKHFYYVRLVHSRGHAVRVVGPLAIVKGRVHDPLTTVPIPLTRSP